MNTIREYLSPFVPMLLEQNAELLELADASKAFYMGTKEYVYRETLSGHEPMERLPVGLMNERKP